MNRTFLLFLAAVLKTVWLAQADALDKWHWRNPTPTMNNLRTVAYAGGNFVAAGDAGAFLTSSNGVDWIQVTSVSGLDSLTSVAFGGGTYVVGGVSAADHLQAPNYSANGICLVSTNGADWVRQILPDSPLSLVTYGAGRYVAVQGSNYIIASSDGIHWADAIGFGIYFSGLTYGNGVFVAVGYGFAHAIPVPYVIASKDGLTWSVYQPEGLVSLDRVELNGVAFGNGKFVATSSPTNIFTSTDGAVWTASSFATNYPSAAVSFGDGQFLIVDGNTLRTSIDGTNWTSKVIPGNQAIRSVTRGNGEYVVVGDGGAIAGSTDGTNWLSPSRSVTSRYLNDVAFAEGVFVSVGEYGTILASTNRTAWADHSVGVTNWFNRVAFGGGRFLAVGESFPQVPTPPGTVQTASGAMYTSSDGNRWTPQTAPTTNELVAIFYREGEFYLKDQSGAIFTSPDGATWTRALPATGYSLGGMAYGNGRLISVWGGAFTSTNGATWSAAVNLRDPNYNNDEEVLSDIAFGNGLFATVGLEGLIATSVDGINWQFRDFQQQSGGANTPFARIVFANGMFFAVGRTIVVTSADGVKWTPHYPGVELGLLGCAFGPESNVIVGEFGAILESDPFSFGPGISFSLVGSALSLSWPTNFSIQASPTLSGTFNWSNFNSAATVSFGRNYLNVDVSRGSQFFRLAP